MKRFIVLYKKEIFELIRLKKLLIVVFLFLFAAVGSPIIAKLLPNILKSLATQGVTVSIIEPTYRDSVDQFIKNISQIVIWVLIFVAAGSIADEKTKKTLELLMVKPISKTSFILAKYVSFYTSIIAVYFISSLIFYFYTISVFERFDFNNFLIIDLLILVYILLIITTTICASALVKSSLMSSGFGFIGLIVYSTLSSFFSDYANYFPDYIIHHYKEILSSGWNNEFVPSLFASLILTFILIIVSIFFFKKQEIER